MKNDNGFWQVKSVALPQVVSIGVPVYRRLNYLENVLRSVGAQDYKHIELIVSDNGMNGLKVPQLVEKYYSRPFRFRQNPATVSISTHFNQIIREASGEYFVLLADDDEISPNYISELVRLLETHRDASIAFGIQETIDESGRTIRSSSTRVPELMSGCEFVAEVWGAHKYCLESLSTFLARTDRLVQSGGYPDFRNGHGNDDALVLKLCLDNFVALSDRCSFRKRLYDTSTGNSSDFRDLSKAIRDFMSFIDSDAQLKKYGQLEPEAWHSSRSYLLQMLWKTYFDRWAVVYRKKLTRMRWIRAAFVLPMIPAYYKAVAYVLVDGFRGHFSKQRPKTAS